ncbi:hypothetical protein Csa_022965 [Cucumis sativus]|nr:hypothetical protein Csa_022965 [Cucumis sativus]
MIFQFIHTYAKMFTVTLFLIPKFTVTYLSEYHHNTRRNKTKYQAEREESTKNIFLRFVSVEQEKSLLHKFVTFARMSFVKSSKLTNKIPETTTVWALAYPIRTQDQNQWYKNLNSASNHRPK